MQGGSVHFLSYAWNSCQARWNTGEKQMLLLRLTGMPGNVDKALCLRALLNGKSFNHTLNVDKLLE